MILSPNFAGLYRPEFAGQDAWMLVREEPVKNSKGELRWTKVPYAPGGGKASSSDPRTWSSFSRVKAAYLGSQNRWHGVGLARTGDWVFCDVDGAFRTAQPGEEIPSDVPMAARDQGMTWSEWPWQKPQPRDIWERFVSMGAYIELSASAEGFHAILRCGTVPRQYEVAVPGLAHAEIAVFTSNRYFVMTGVVLHLGLMQTDPADALEQLAGLVVPERIGRGAASRGRAHAGHGATERQEPWRNGSGGGELGDDALLDKALADSQTRAVFGGQWEGYFPSQSEADLWLLTKFAFWTAKNVPQLIRLFERSALNRDKWRDREDYRERTINKALEQCSNVYTPRKAEARAAQASGNGAGKAHTTQARPAADEPHEGHAPSAEEPPGGCECGPEADRAAAQGGGQQSKCEEPGTQKKPGEKPDLLSPMFNDAGNAERIRRVYGKRMLWSVAEKCWYIWDGRRWKYGASLQAQSLAKKAMRAFLVQAIRAENRAAMGFATGSLDQRRIRNALESLQSELRVDVDQFDTQPYLLNFANDTVDLRTGERHPHRREDRITRLIGHDYEPGAQCPGFLAFVGKIMGARSDATDEQKARTRELVSYIHRALGYSITGETGEKAVFVAHGRNGDNGKTTLLSIVREVMAGYAVTIPLDVLMTRDTTNNVDAARAELRGVRFATTSETEEGQRLSAARLKQICQGPGGVIRACRKYENPVAFKETHKLWIDANHKPELPPNDTAAWNRLHLIPFDVQIPKDEQDRLLKENLLATEACGILALLVQGAKDWYAEGLLKSDTVDKATGKWREEVDRLKTYLAEHTIKATDAEAWIWNKVLYPAYRTWAEECGERPLPQKVFSQQMADMGYISDRQNEGVRWVGLRFRKPEHDPPPCV